MNKNLINRKVIIPFIFSFIALNISAQSSNLNFTPEEILWISEHDTLLVANETDWPPFDFAIENEPQGYSIDHFDLVGEKTGLVFKYVNGYSWSEIMEKFRASEIDILPAIYSTEDRREFISFTDMYATNPSVIVIKSDQSQISQLSDLEGRVVGAIQGYATAQALEERHPEIKIKYVKNALEGLLLVSIGEIDAFIESLGIVSYHIENSFLNDLNLKLANGLKTPEEMELHIGVLKDNSILRDIIQKGIDAISSEENQKIKDLWFPNEILSSEAQSTFNVKWINIVIIAGSFLLILIAGAFILFYKKNLKIGLKIFSLLIFTSITSVGIIGYLSYKIGKDTLEKEFFTKLTAVREMKANQIEDYFQFISDQIVTMSENRMIIDAMKAFDSGVHEIDHSSHLNSEHTHACSLGIVRHYEKEFFPKLSLNLNKKIDLSQYIPTSPETIHLQHLYITENQYDVGKKHLLNSASDQSSYTKAHKIYHPIIRNFLEKFGYHDIFLIDVETGGHIAYSVYKEVDFATSLVNGPYKNTGLGRVYKSALESDTKDFIFLDDFEAYHPSYNAPAAFIASPIYDGETKIGILAFQLPIDKINDIMTSNQSWESVGLGETGETYIVGDDYKIRNQSRFLIEDPRNYFSMIEELGTSEEVINQIKNYNSTIGLQEVKTEATTAALSGKVGASIITDYRGISVLSSYRPLKINGVNWAIMSEIDESEAFSAISSMIKQMVIWLLILFSGIIVIAIVFSRSLTSPILKLTQHAKELADGNMDVAIRTNHSDEIGTLAQSFDTMRISVKNLLTEITKHKDELEERVIARTKDLEESAKQLKTQSAAMESAVNGIVITDPDGIIKWVNPAFTNLTGYSYKEAIGQNPSVLNSGKHDKKFYTKLWDTINAGKVWAGETINKRKDGSLYTEEMTITPVLDSDGKIVNFVAIKQDITERKRLEEIVIKAKERMEEELNVAKDIQMNMLPLIFPAFPNHTEFAIYADLIPAREVGGDFYDFFFIDDDRICFVVGDVSGKGVPAALFMAVTKTLIKSRAMSDFSTASIFTHINDELSKDNDSSMFVTIFACIVNIRTGEMVYTNAGHNPPYIKRENAELERMDILHGPVVGAMEDFTYKESMTTLLPGEMAILFTDGVTEAMDIKNNLFSEERLVDHLSTAKWESAENNVKSIVDKVKEFEGKADQTDDITVLSFKYLGSAEEEAMFFDITIKNGLPAIDEVRERFDAFADAHNIDTKIKGKMNVAFDELINNIISYSFKDDREHDIFINVKLVNNQLSVIITDDGIPFDPFSSKTPDTNLSIEERGIGGLGIHLVRNMMDKVSYERKDDKNIITLIKSLNS